MRQFWRISAFAAMVAVVMASLGQVADAQKKKKGKAKDNIEQATPADYKTIETYKNLTGTIMSMTTTSLTLRVENPRMKPNPKYKPPKVTNPKSKGYNAAANQQYQLSRTYNDLMRQQQIAMTTTNPRTQMQAMNRFYQDLARFQQQTNQQYMRMMNQYNQAMARDVNAYAKAMQNNTSDPFIIVKMLTEFELDIQDKAVVRKSYLPLEYDDTGNIKKYSDKEKEALRGDDKTKPGYKATIEEATVGSEAKIYLTPPPKKKTESKSDKDSKPDEAGVFVPDRPTINMLLLTKEGPTSNITGAKEEKKKKKKN